MMDFYETVRTIVLAHYKEEQKANEFYNLITQEHITSVNKGFHIINFEHSSVKMNNSTEKLLENEFFKHVKNRVVKEEDWLDQDEDVNHDKVFIALFDMKYIPFIPHLAIIISILETVTHELWLRSKSFQLEKLLTFIRDHLLDSLRIFDVELKRSTIFKSFKKIEFGKFCDKNKPILKEDCQLYKLLDHYGMVNQIIGAFRRGSLRSHRKKYRDDADSQRYNPSEET